VIGTHFSADRRYRYTLHRSLAAPYADEGLGPRHATVLFIGCNPSDASEIDNDPTVTRETNFARSWGFTDYLKGNVFAYVESDGNKFKRDVRIDQRHHSLQWWFGPDNLDWLAKMIAAAELVVCAWGALAAAIDEGACDLVNAQIPTAKRRVLRLTKAGHPWHPLYLPKSLQPVPWPEVRL
jgi:hypothetical protein